MIAYRLRVRGGRVSKVCVIEFIHPPFEVLEPLLDILGLGKLALCLELHYESSTNTNFTLYCDRAAHQLD